MCWEQPHLLVRYDSYMFDWTALDPAFASTFFTGKTKNADDYFDEVYYSEPAART